MCLQRLIKAIMQDTGISILTAQSDPKFEASFPLRENAGCPETNGKTLLVEYYSEVFQDFTSAFHMELLSSTTSLWRESRQHKETDVLYSCTLNFPSAAHGHPQRSIPCPVPGERHPEKFFRGAGLWQEVCCSDANSAPHMGTGNTVSKRISSETASNES